MSSNKQPGLPTEVSYNEAVEASKKYFDGDDLADLDRDEDALAARSDEAVGVRLEGVDGDSRLVEAHGSALSL